MPEASVVFPLLPGKREALAEFVEKLNGERHAEYVASQVTVVQESWFVQPTPMGDLIIVHLEAPDPLAVFAGLAVSEEPFDAWFRAQVQDITGVDLTQMPPGLPERVFHYVKA